MTSVSVCIPSYNGAAYLRECIQSARAQTWDDLEIVINDDASSDETRQIAALEAAADGRVKVFRNDCNLGLVGNWNATVGRAQGEWIKLLFQDDILAPDCVSTMLAAARKDGARFVAGWRDFDFTAGNHGCESMYVRSAKLIRALYERAGKLTSDEVAEFACRNVGINFVGEPTCTLMHRSVFTAVGEFDPALTQRCDTEYWVRAGLRFGVTMVGRSLATFRVHPASTSAQNYARRSFADEWLDPLVILHHYLFDPRYAPLRDWANRHGHLEQLRRRFYDNAHDAMTIARGMSGESDEFRDWHCVASRLPELTATPLSQTLGRVLRRLAGRLGV